MGRSVRRGPAPAAAGVLAVVAVLLAGLLGLPGAARADTYGGTAWDGTGPTGVVVSDGTSQPPQFQYALSGAGYGQQQWTFTTAVDADTDVTVPYQYVGFHAYFQVTVGLEAVVIDDAGVSATTLVSDGPVDCCTPPSGGFSYTGSHTFHVTAGSRFGFRMSGSNFDRDNRLQGTLSLAAPTATSPYVDDAAVASNTSWPNAAPLTSSGVTGSITAPGEARWWKFDVVPDSQVRLDLTGLDQNLDLTLFTDIGQAFTRLTTPGDLALLGAQFAGDAYAPSVYSPSVYSPSVYSPSVYSPSVYSPSVYSPSVYSPSVYSPSVYSPSVYSPSVYSPSVYSPSVYSPSVYSPSPEFASAFSSAQTRSLLAVSAREGTAPESITAATWNNTGSFYVRVQGRNGASSATPFQLGLTTTGGPCTGVALSSFAGSSTLTGSPGAASAVILTDSSRLAVDSALAGALDALASRTGGVVVDVAGSPRVAALNRQADANPACPYAKNLVAQSIRDIVNSYRDGAGTLRYVVLAGGDAVLPFFRYADPAGLAPETDYVPPVLDSSASQASLRGNKVLSQDAYGAATDLTLKGAQLPLPDVAVGRLVETPGEIAAQIGEYLGLPGGTLPSSSGSLVTGYDFLASSADAVQAELVAGLPPAAPKDALVTDQGVSPTTTTGPGGPSRATSWTATDLAGALFGRHHDVVYLAGHFSANNALAADYATSLLTTDLEAHPGTLTNTLVFSAGCHSGYNIVDADGVPSLTQPLDWAQAVARQRGLLVAGTGYQYGDTDFVAYSAKLYALLARELRSGTPGTPVAVGTALLRAKQDYLAGVSTVSGIDQKSLLESTLFGLPMTGLDLPGRTGAPPAVTGGATPTPVAAGGPGAALGLESAPLALTPALQVNGKPALGPDGTALGTTLRWLSGPDGVVTGPALPTLPRLVTDVTSTTGTVLRGVGFRSGRYTDTPGVTPLTGAPVTELNGVHSSFDSPVFYPQQLAAPNFFGTLTAGGDGRVRLVTTPAQYRSDGAGTDVERAYQALGFQLFYSGNIATYGQNTPALAAPPSISGVTSTVRPDGSALDVAVHVTGDPSAGVEGAWVTYTAGTGPFYGSWASLDLTQDGNDSTLWTGTLALPAGQDAASVRFWVQAVNGVGLVGVDNALGVGYTPGVAVGTVPPGATATSLTLDPATPTSVPAGATLQVAATLTGAPTGSAVSFSLGAGTATARTDGTGRAAASLLVGAPVGPADLTASYAGDAATAPATAPASAARSVDVVAAPSRIDVVPAGGALESAATPRLGALLTAAGVPLRQKSVLLTVLDAGGATVARAPAITDLAGVARLGVTLPSGRYTLQADFGQTAQGQRADPVYAPAATSAAVTVYRYSGVQPPLDPAGGSVAKAGSTVPVKFTLSGPGGPVTGVRALFFFSRLAGGSAGSPPPPGATTGDVFASQAQGEYHFNWKTKGLAPGRYRLDVVLGDGVARPVLVTLR